MPPRLHLAERANVKWSFQLRTQPSACKTARRQGAHPISGNILCAYHSGSCRKSSFVEPDRPWPRPDGGRITLLRPRSSARRSRPPRPVASTALCDLTRTKHRTRHAPPLAHNLRAHNERACQHHLFFFPRDSCMSHPVQGNRRVALTASPHARSMTVVCLVL